MNLKNKYTIFFSSLIALSSLIHLPAFSKSIMVSQESNMGMSIQKQQVVALLKSIENGDAKPVSYINANKYIQHNLNYR
jgi:hypothetical protein